MKYFKKFYEIGNNRYYTLEADGDLYIASDSFIKFKRRFLNYNNKLVQGLKLLKITPPILVLFATLDSLEPLKNQKNVSEDMIKYRKVNNKELKETIKFFYNKAILDEIDNIDSYIEDLDKNSKDYNKLLAHAEKTKDYYKSQDLLVKNGYSLDSPEHTSGNIIATMMREGLNHLYTERVTAFMNNIFLYEVDCFGTLTIYRVITVKNVVKTIDTFIYDKKLVNKLLENDKIINLI